MPKKGKKSKPTGINILNFTEDDVRILTNLFSVLANEKRLDILKTTIAEDITRLKDLAKELGEKNSAQIALHAKKLFDAGLLKKEGASLRDSREYVPTIIDETYIFLRVALKYAQILNARQTELELEHLKANAEAASERLAGSPTISGTVSFSDDLIKYNDSIKLAREEYKDLVSKFSKMINVTEI
jgi:DNA-binding transcriptional ArsR family regulator